MEKTKRKCENIFDCFTLYWSLKNYSKKETKEVEIIIIPNALKLHKVKMCNYPEPIPSPPDMLNSFSEVFFL